MLLALVTFICASVRVQLLSKYVQTMKEKEQVGSIIYLSPEALDMHDSERERNDNSQTDIYAFGLIALEVT